MLNFQRLFVQNMAAFRSRLRNVRQNRGKSLLITHKYQNDFSLKELIQQDVTVAITEYNRSQALHACILSNDQQGAKPVVLPHTTSDTLVTVFPKWFHCLDRLIIPYVLIAT